MKLRTLIPSIVLCAVVAFAADVSGNWKGEMHTAEGGAFPMSLMLKVDGGNLTGSITQGEKGSPRELENAKVDGDQISFSLSYKLASGETRKTNFTGKLDGNQLKLTSQREGSQRKQETTLERP